ncbi:hypothetical protein, partial [Nocardioides sp.]|uniref:hypothetical protein n=1 Tax=Nocardioides sp. TaxID=35761 RepID=UPI002734A1AE
MPEASLEHRHRAARPSWLGTAVASTIVVLLLGGLLTTAYLQRPGSSPAAESSPPDPTTSACPDQPLQIAAVPAVAAVVEEALTEADCTHYAVTAAESAATSQSLTAGENPPDVWIPDS